jgi:cytochrome c oxidase subunit 1
MSSHNTHSTETDILIETKGFDDHFHEHHEGDKYQMNFISKWIFSMDHKIIARQFLMTGIFWAIIGAGMSIIFRLQLGFPDASITWLKPLLGTMDYCK